VELQEPGRQGRQVVLVLGGEVLEAGGHVVGSAVEECGSFGVACRIGQHDRAENARGRPEVRTGLRGGQAHVPASRVLGAPVGELARGEKELELGAVVMLAGFLTRPVQSVEVDEAALEEQGHAGSWLV
jgi:hypothetical protein